MFINKPTHLEIHILRKKFFFEKILLYTATDGRVFSPLLTVIFYLANVKNGQR